MALSSSSTLAQVEAQYDDNAGYETLGSKSLRGPAAKLFLEATKILKRRTAKSIAGDGANITERDFTTDIAEAREFLNNNDSDLRAGPTVTRVGFRDFRSA